MDNLEAIGIARKALFERGNMRLNARAKRMEAAPSEGTRDIIAQREADAYNTLAAMRF